MEQKNGYIKNKKKKYRIVAVDYGIKKNILRCFSDLHCEVKIVPAKTSSQKILNENPDGIFLSNGPGDPAATGKYAIPVIKQLIKSKLPIFELQGSQIVNFYNLQPLTDWVKNKLDSIQG